MAPSILRGGRLGLGLGAAVLLALGGVAIGHGGDPRPAAASPARGETEKDRVAEVVAALGPGARVSRSTHFVVVSDCEHAWTRDRQTILERTFAAVERFARRVDAPFEWTGERLMCVLIEDHADYRAFAAAQDGVRAEWVAGYYSSAPNRVVFYDDRTAPWTREAHADLEREAEAARRRIATIEGREAGVARMLEEEGEAIDRVVRSERARIEAAALERAEAKTVHEAAHLVAFNTGLQLRTHRYPFWITEGIGTAFETADSRGAFGPWSRYGPRDGEVRERLAGFEPLEAFLGRTDAPADREGARSAYAQAYALFTFAATREPRALGGLLRDIAAEPAGETTGRRLVELFAGRFGPMDAFEARWSSWLAVEFSGAGR